MDRSTEYDLLDQYIDPPRSVAERRDRWRNPVLFLPHLFGRTSTYASIGPDGLARVPTEPVSATPGLTLPPFGMPRRSATARIDVSPSVPGHVWAYTGGPHAGWGSQSAVCRCWILPPPRTHPDVTQCPMMLFATAMADGSGRAFRY
ncbi:MAG: hypothetical protein MZV64_24020 [Ignavibacteriales bacterium]|nr:hypothetical protein [Ignavibacteriales bacterium]